MNLASDMKNNDRIPIGCSIDDIMGGGVEKGSITQFYGPPSSGKTNIALKLVVQSAKNGKKAIFVDTEGGLSTERIRQIAGSDFDNFAANIIVFEPTTFEEQDEVLKKINNLLDSRKENIELLILDSAVALYRVKEGDSSQINRELGKQMALLSRMARKHGIAVIVTNHIYSVYDGDGTMEPVGGMVLKYWSKIMVELVELNVNGERFAIIKRHKSKPEGLKAKFRIVERGLK